MSAQHDNATCLMHVIIYWASVIASALIIGVCIKSVVSVALGLLLFHLANDVRYGES